MPGGRPNRPLFDLIPEEADQNRKRPTTDAGVESAGHPADADTPDAGATLEFKPRASRPSGAPAGSTLAEVGSGVSTSRAVSPRQDRVAASRTRPDAVTADPPFVTRRGRGTVGQLIATGRSSMQLTLPWVAGVVVAALAIVLAVWIIAYRVGATEASRKLIVAGADPSGPPDLTSLGGTDAQALGEKASALAAEKSKDAARGNSNQATRPSDPNAPTSGSARQNPPSIATKSGSSPEPSQNPAKPDPQKPEPAKPPADSGSDPVLPPADRTDSGPVVAFAGTYKSDPRTPGHNYLVLATGMTREDARDSVDFLGRNGFQTLAVPMRAVDRNAGGDKNTPLYKLVSAQGFEGGQMRETQRTRDAMVERIRTLGLTYQRVHRGKYDFARVNWEKFTP